MPATRAFTDACAEAFVLLNRDSTGLQQLLDKEGCLLNEYKQNIHVVDDPSTSGISSTILRQQLRYVSHLLQQIL